MEERQINTITIDGTPLFRKMDGIGRYTVSFIRQLSEELPGTNIIIIGFIDDKKKNSLLSPLPKNVSVKYIPIPRKVYQFLFARLFAFPVNMFLSVRPDWHIATNFTAFPHIKALKTAVVIHDLAFKDTPETIEVRNLAYLQKRVPWTLMHCDSIITVSYFTKDRLLHHYPNLSLPITVVPPEVHAFKDTRNYHTVHSKYSLPDTFILSVGTSEPRKNLATLIDGFLGLPKEKQKSFPLVIVGAKGWGDIQYQSADNIYFTGYVDDEDLPAIYKACSLFVFPSIYEGFGLPVAEAILAEKPVISSDLPSVREFASDTIHYVGNSTEANNFTKAIECALNTKENIDTTKSISNVNSFWKHNSIKSFLEIL